MSANYDAAVQARGTADVTHAELQSLLMAPEPDEGRLDTIRAAASHAEAAALFYAVMAVADAVHEGPDVTHGAVIVPGLASQVAREIDKQSRRRSRPDVEVNPPKGV